MEGRKVRLEERKEGRGRSGYYRRKDDEENGMR